STVWMPPHRTAYLRMFALSLLLVVLALAVCLFAVRMEAIVPATGTLQARDQQDVRALVPGLVEAGWYAGTVAQPSGEPLRLRLGSPGGGTTDPAQGKSLTVTSYKLPGGPGGGVAPVDLRFHQLRAGDQLWPGQVLARVQADDWLDRLARLEGRLQDLEGRGEPAHEVRSRRDALRERLARSTLSAPGAADV